MSWVVQNRQPGDGGCGRSWGMSSLVGGTSILGNGPLWVFCVAQTRGPGRGRCRWSWGTSILRNGSLWVMVFHVAQTRGPGHGGRGWSWGTSSLLDGLLFPCTSLCTSLAAPCWFIKCCRRVRYTAGVHLYQAQGIQILSILFQFLLSDLLGSLPAHFLYVPSNPKRCLLQ